MNTLKSIPLLLIAGVHRLVSLYVVGVILAYTCVGQHFSERFDRFSVQQGLSDYSVMALLQDSSGYIWIGTQNGLNRYDGVHFKPYVASPADTNSLNDGFIFDLLEGEKGNIWLATMNEGLIQFDVYNEEFITHAYSESEEGRGLRTICYDSEGKMWLGALNGGLFRYDPETKISEDYSGIISHSDSLDIFAVYEASSFPGIIWVGTDKGLYGMNYRTHQAAQIGNGNNSPPENVRAIYEDRSGALWIGGENGLYWYDPESQQLISRQYLVDGQLQPVEFSIRAILEDHRGALWLGTNEDGLKRYDALSNTILSFHNKIDAPHSLSNNAVRSILQDDSEMLWVGTFAGLNKYNPYREEVLQIDSEAFNGAIMAVEEDSKGNIWLGTGGDLHVWDRSVDQLYAPLSDTFKKSVYALLRGAGDKLWVGTEDHAVYEVDVTTLETRRFALPGESLEPVVDVLAPKAMNNKQFWVGTKRDGLFLFDMVKEMVVAHFPMNESLDSALDQETIWAILDLGQDGVWVGTWGGLYVLNPESRSVRKFVPDARIPGHISSEKITELVQDNAGIIWIGTHDRGLNRYDPETGIFTVFTSDNGLLSDNISDIVKDDDGNLWVSTNNGVSQVNPLNRQISSYDVSYGFKEEPFLAGAAQKSSTGEVFFGGSNGLNMFYPEGLQMHDRTPVIALTDFSVNDAPVLSNFGHLEAKEFKLSYDENFLRFQFAVLDYVMPQKNRYRYRLVGAEEHWVETTGEVFARYPNLTPGKYEFQVQGSNNHGIWSDVLSYGPIRIKPVWWDSTWFRVLAFSLILGLGIGFHRYRVSQLLRMERMRIRIAGDLHDDLGGKLSSIAVLSDIVQNRDNLPPSDKNRLEKVSNTARLMVREVRDIIWFIKPEHDNMEDMVMKMQNIADALLGNIEYSFEVSTGVMDEMLNMDIRRHFLLCYKEILNNIVKHAHASLVEIQISKQEGELLLSVKDNGVGFDEEEIQRGEGLNNLQQRAERMYGKIYVSSALGEGTSIMLRAKIMDSHRTKWLGNFLFKN